MNGRDDAANRRMEIVHLLWARSLIVGDRVR
jgi:hypothetical protein